MSYIAPRRGTSLRTLEVYSMLPYDVYYYDTRDHTETSNRLMTNIQITRGPQGMSDHVFTATGLLRSGSPTPCVLIVLHRKLVHQ
jgi:hypothetical protein